MTAARFPPGQIVATSGALAALEEAGESPGILLKRHLSGDWGEVDEHDRREDELSIAQGFRLLSAYPLSNGIKLWIITEADRSSTTILLPSEY
jgi:hypothetical protein